MSTEFGVLCNLRSSNDSESPLWMIPAQILEQYPFCANEKPKQIFQNIWWEKIVIRIWNKIRENMS